MAELNIHLFGYPRIERSGSPLKLDRRKAMALVAYLAVSDAPHRRVEIAALLWPELDERKARRALRRTLFALHDATEGKLLVANNDELTLETRGVWCDARQFLDAARPGATAQALTRASTLYRGDFLQGFSIRDSVAFEQWHLLECERFRNRAVGALEQLLAVHVAEHRLAPSLECARQLLKEDPFHEGAHRAVMHIYQKQGRPERALAQFARYRELLREQLDCEPAEELRLASERIRSKRPASEPRDSDALSAAWSRAVESESRQEIAALFEAASHRFDVGGFFAEGAVSLSAAVEALKDDDPLVGRILIRLGALETSRGRLRAARDALAHGLARTRERGELRDTAYGCNRLGYVTFALGRRQDGFHSLERSISMFRDLKDRAGLAWSLNVLGHLHAESGITSGGRTKLEESLEIASQLGDAQRLASTLNSLGKTSLRERKREAARELLEQSLRLRRAIGHRIGVADALNNLGDVAAASDEHDRAAEQYQRAMSIALEIQATPLVLESFIGMADQLKRNDERPAAVSLLAIARHHESSWWYAKRRAAAALAKLGPSLSKRDFQRAAAEGRRMSCSVAASRFVFL